MICENCRNAVDWNEPIHHKQCYSIIYSSNHCTCQHKEPQYGSRAGHTGDEKEESSRTSG